MKFYLTYDGLSYLQENAKIISYVSPSLTKTFFKITAETFSIHFRGMKAGLDIEVPFSSDEESFDGTTFLIDYSKWANALSKLTFAERVDISVTSKQVRISTPASKDVIALGITTVDASLIPPLSQLEAQLTRGGTPVELIYSDALGRALSTTAGLFSAAGRNNAVEVGDTYVMYADRSVVARLDIPSTGFKQPISLHRFLSGFISLSSRFSPNYSIYPTVNALKWRSGKISVIVVSEPPEIAMPSEQDLQAIRPAEDQDSYGAFSVQRSAFVRSLSFFNGFYEATAWKPISITNDGDRGKLYYSHPTTEIEKDLQVTDVEGAGCVAMLSAESLEKALAGDDGDIRITFSETSPGVRCVVDGEIDVLFSKLRD